MNKSAKVKNLPKNPAYGRPFNLSKKRKRKTKNNKENPRKNQENPKTMNAKQKSYK